MEFARTSQAVLRAIRGTEQRVFLFLVLLEHSGMELPVPALLAAFVLLAPTGQDFRVWQLPINVLLALFGTEMPASLTLPSALLALSGTAHPARPSRANVPPE
jgi:hypothetical protein